MIEQKPIKNFGEKGAWAYPGTPEFFKGIHIYGASRGHLCPTNIPISLIFPETRFIIHWPTFLLLIVWVYLHSHLSSGLQKTHLFCDRVRFGCSRSFKVDDFGTNRKRICDLPLVIYSNCGPILHRFRNTATYWLKIAYFSYPSFIRALTP